MSPDTHFQVINEENPNIIINIECHVMLTKTTQRKKERKNMKEGWISLQRKTAGRQYGGGGGDGGGGRFPAQAVMSEEGSGRPPRG